MLEFHLSLPWARSLAIASMPRPEARGALVRRQTQGPGHEKEKQKAAVDGILPVCGRIKSSLGKRTEFVKNSSLA